MPVCQCCAHHQTDEINRSIISGDSERTIAKRFGVSAASVHRHKRNHLPVTLLKAHDIAEVAQANGLLGQMRELTAKTLSILEIAEQKGDIRAALQAIRESRANMVLSATLLAAAQASAPPPPPGPGDEPLDLSCLNAAEYFALGLILAKLGGDPGPAASEFRPAEGRILAIFRGG